VGQGCVVLYGVVILWSWGSHVVCPFCRTSLSLVYISMAYFTTIVTLLFDENDIFISLESSIHALQDGCSISVGYKI